MAQSTLIDLDWWKDPKGYRLEKTGLPKMMRVVRNGRTSDKLDHCRPLDSSHTLFSLFANTATTPDGVLEFVKKYGPLTIFGNDQGDLVSDVIRRAQIMNSTLKWLRVQSKRLTKSDQLAGMPGVTLHALLDWDSKKGRPVWKLRPSTLIDGLWLQFTQAVTRGVEFRTCEHCGIPFEVGPGTDRRLDARFCSDDHRIKFNSLKRSRS